MSTSSSTGTGPEVLGADTLGEGTSRATELPDPSGIFEGTNPGGPPPHRRGVATRLLELLRRSVLEGPETSVPRPRSEINLQWLIHLRWVAIAGQLITILVVHFGLGVEIPLPALFVVVGLEAGTNAGLLLVQRREVRRRLGGVDAGAEPRSGARLRALQLGVTVLDIALLTVLLSLTGGTSNPFCGFLVVHVALAAVLLPMRHSLVAAAAVAIGLSVMREVHTEVLELESAPALRGWGTVVSIALTSLLTVLFVSRVVSAVVRRAEGLETERERRERRRHLEALGTLAAGAAHELGTPLSTIAIASKELELRLARTDGPEDPATIDARLIRDEVARCRRILDRMSTDTGDRSNVELVRVSAREFADAIVGEMAAASRIELEIVEPESDAVLELPVEGLATAIRAIAQNAIDASPPDGLVRLKLVREDAALVLTIGDRGTGMTPAQAERALEPFFTTKDVGVGMGLGLFLANSFVEGLGGTIEIQSVPGLGTVVGVVLPLAMDADGVLRATVAPL